MLYQKMLKSKMLQKSFFSNFPYQRDVCKEVLAEMKVNNIK